MSRGLGDVLVRIGVIDAVQLASALARQQQWGGHLLTHLVQARMLKEDHLVAALADRFRYPAAHPLPMLIEAPVLDLLPGEFCARFLVLPIALVDDHNLTLAMADPSDLATVDTVQARTRRHVHVAVGGPKAIVDAIQSHYFGQRRSEGRPDPFMAGADAFGADLLAGMSPVLSPPPAPAPALSAGRPLEIELPPGVASDEDLVPRPSTAESFLGEVSGFPGAERVDVGDLFSEADGPAAGRMPGLEPTARVAQPGPTPDHVPTGDPYRNGGSPYQEHTRELPMDAGRRGGGAGPSAQMPHSVMSTEGDLLLVAVDPVGGSAGDRAKARRESAPKPVPAVTPPGAAAEPPPRAPHADRTLGFGSPVAGSRPAAPAADAPARPAGQADKAIQGARAYSAADPSGAPAPAGNATIAASPTPPPGVIKRPGDDRIAAVEAKLDRLIALLEGAGVLPRNPED